MAKNKNTVVELVETTTEIEVPYELPDGWKWVRLGELFSHATGKALKKDNQNGIKRRYITTSNIYWGYFDFSEIREMYFEENEMEKCTAKKGDLLICNGGDIGRSAIWNYDYDICLQNHVSKLRKLNDSLLTQFYYYLLLFYKQSGFLNGKGIGISSLSAKDLLNLIVPLSTLEEQQRIVNQIETLFVKLDEAKEKAQNVVDTFETRKASILHKAFTGELTKKWREENVVGDDSWEEKTGETIFSYITSGSRGWASYYSDAGEMFIRMGNLNHGTIDLELSNIQYVDLPDSVEGTRSQLKEKDILISITADLGMIGLVRKLNTNAYINQHIALARPSSEVNAEFIAWELVSDIGFSQLQGNKKGSTKIGLGLSDIKNLRLLVPTLPEQTEIVLILDKLFEKENKAKEAAEAVLEQIDLLKKSILARAFRGEL